MNTKRNLVAILLLLLIVIGAFAWTAINPAEEQLAYQPRPTFEGAEPSHAQIQPAVYANSSNRHFRLRQTAWRYSAYPSYYATIPPHYHGPYYEEDRRNSRALNAMIGGAAIGAILGGLYGAAAGGLAGLLVGSIFGALIGALVGISGGYWGMHIALPPLIFLF